MLPHIDWFIFSKLFVVFSEYVVISFKMTMHNQPRKITLNIVSILLSDIYKTRCSFAVRNSDMVPGFMYTFCLQFAVRNPQSSFFNEKFPLCHQYRRYQIFVRTRVRYCHVFDNFICYQYIVWNNIYDCNVCLLVIYTCSEQIS